MRKTSLSIIIATLLVFVARYLFDRATGQEDILSAGIIAGIFAAIGSVLNYVVQKLKAQSADGKSLSESWTRYLLFGWITSLMFVLVDAFLEINQITSALFMNYFIIPAVAAVVLSVLVTIFTMVKVIKFDGQRIDYAPAYFVAATIINSVMLYVFVLTSFKRAQ